MPMHIQTPLLESVPLSRLSGKKVYLKLENVQTAGSFKIRGIGLLCQQLYGRGKRLFICPSSGNAGYAVAWAARELGARALIVAPEGTNPSAIDAVRSLGGEVLVQGKVWDESNLLALQLGTAAAENAYITSYDDPTLWSGHATMIDEIAAQCPCKPDGVLLSVGGGGLVSGVAEGLIRNGWADVPIVGCGVHGANAFSQTVKAGRLVDIGRTSTLVHCISATHVTAHVVELMSRIRFLPYVTSDLAAVSACERFLDDHRLLVDPACGVTLSALYDHAPVIDGMRSLVIIVCGGVGITYRELMEVKAQASLNPNE